MNFFNDPKYKVFYIKPNSKEPFDKWNSEEKWKNYKGCVCNEQYNHALWLAGSGLVAIDYDPRNEDSQTPKVLLKLSSFLLSTYSHATQSGGRHYIFSLDKDFAYTFKGKICNGIDIKYNGYIVIPPSSIDGNKYEEVKESENPILPLPKEVEDYCLYRLDEDTQESYAITPDRDKKFDYELMSKDIQEYANKNKLGYETWYNLGMCLYNIFEGKEKGLECFRIISNNKYYSDNDLSLLNKWNSFKGNKNNKRVGIGKLSYFLGKMGLDLDQYLDIDYFFESAMEEKKESTLEEDLSSWVGEDEKIRKEKKINKSSNLRDILYKHTKNDNLDEEKVSSILTALSNIGLNLKSLICIESTLEELAVKYFNKFVAYIENSKSYAVLRDIGTAKEDFTLYNNSQFKDRFAHLSFRVGSKLVCLSDYYVKSKHRRFFSDIAYAPRSNNASVITVFPRGCVSIEPHDTDYDPAVIKPFCDMIYHNMCGVPIEEEELDEENLRIKKNLYNYIVWYVAHTLRKPQEAQSVILAFWGDQGTGKNTFTETIEKLFISPRMVSNTMADQLEGVYTDFVAKSFWCVINEFPPKLESKAWARLKAYTGTSGFLTMNPKGERQYQATIRARFITTSNLYPAFGETSDNRRVVRIQTEKHIRDFSELARLKYNENFLHNLAKYFNTINLNEFEPCVIPKRLIMSREELEMEKTLKKERTRDTEVMHEAFLELLTVDEAPYIIDKKDKKFVSLKLLFKSVYQKFYELTGLRKSMEYQTSVQFINKMARFYPHPNPKIKAPKQITVSRFGEVMKVYDLDEMRAYFLVGNSLNWDD